MRSRKKTWDVGNVFAIPLSDGSYSLGQVVGREAEALNSITCAFYKTKVTHIDDVSIREIPKEEDLISVQFTTPDLLKKRVWKVLGVKPVTLEKEYFPYEETRSSGWVGAKVIGSGIIVHFLEAYFGNEPWDQMADGRYFDKLLISENVKPKELKYKDAS